ncbi:MAG: hypothetical protein EXX96DRAFT_609791 [Benjaminiella poitrasii]|nr:MAG: hypothetical protein EXX96DRAFT_609791 [Benjaminiella poitrasii]
MSNLTALDMALDDVISKNRSNKRNVNSNRRNTRGGGISKNRSTGGRSSPYNGARSSRNTAAPRRTTSSVSRNNNSLVVANLHFNVTEKDLYDLFGQIGPVKRAFLHIGPNGKSAGIADVVFQSSQDAERAKNTYNNVELDGRPMRITNASIVSTVNNSISTTRNDRRNNNNNNSSRPRGGNNPRRRRRETRPKLSQEDLDADMDSYMGNTNEDTQMN